MLELMLFAVLVAPKDCTITSANAACVFDAGGPLLQANLTPGTYSFQEYALMLEDALWAADNDGTYQVYFHPDTGHVTIDRLDAGSGPGLLNLRVSASPLCWALFGFTGTDRTGSLFYEGNTTPHCRRPRATTRRPALIVR